MRAATILPSADVLRECFDYNPETGELKWKIRPRNHFLSDEAYYLWNVTTAGKGAGCKRSQRSTKRNAGVTVTFTIREHRYKTGTHRVILAMNGINVPYGKVIDHINGDAFDNRLSNLRVCSHAENIRNNPGYRLANHAKRSLPKGVYRNHKGFQAAIRHNGKLTCLGTFPTPEEASAAYQAKAKELHGEFYRAC